MMIGDDLPFAGITVSSAITRGVVCDEVGAECTKVGVNPTIEEGAIRIGIESSMGWKRRRARIDTLLRLRDQHKRLYVHE
jgi:hypothetical protein